MLTTNILYFPNNNNSNIHTQTYANRFQKNAEIKENMNCIVYAFDLMLRLAAGGNSN